MRISTAAASASASRSSRRATSRDFARRARAVAAATATPCRATSLSASRTLSWRRGDLVRRHHLLRARRARAARARGPCRGRRRAASAAPARPGSAGAAGCVAALRERPTACAACSCVSWNSVTSRCRPCASSSGLRSSRWMFSISAITAAASSGTALDQHRHAVEAGQLRGAEAALAGDDLVARRRRAGARGSAASRPGS